MKEGRVLVVDEADKAPVEVTVVLKGLIEDGEMLLSDGRRIVREEKKANLTRDQVNQQNYVDGDESAILVHPDFRMIVLANRPGYPFKGK